MSSRVENRGTERSRLLLPSIDEDIPCSTTLWLRPWIILSMAFGFGLAVLVSIESYHFLRSKANHAVQPAVVVRPVHSENISDSLLGCDATVLLMRHCEKEDLREHCSRVGFERATYLASLFGTRWMPPSYLFAEKPSGRNNPKKHNFREIETLSPTARKFSLTIDASYDTHHTADLVSEIFHLLDSGELCNKLAVISWKHSDIPNVARYVGCGSNEGCPSEYASTMFDEVWKIQVSLYKLLKQIAVLLFIVSFKIILNDSFIMVQARHRMWKINGKFKAHLNMKTSTMNH
jgi:hypothetical protein